MKEKRLLALLMALSLLFGLVVTPASAASFKDTQSNWAAEAIDRWSEAGVVIGDENGNFNPAANMTRAEFAVVLNRVMQYQATATNPFSDVPASSWYTEDVLKVYAAGVITGTSATTMSPSANLTREQAMVLLGRALGIEENASGASKFSDASQIGSYAVGYVGGMADAGYIQGSDGKVNPKANITRAEVVTILNNVITTWAATPGQTVKGSANGITVVAAPNVTVTGKVGSLMVTPGAASGTLTLSDAKVDEILTVNAPSVSLTLKGAASASRVDVTEAGKGVTVSLDKDASIGTLVTAADNVSVTGDGSINRFTVSAGKGVTVSKNVVVSNLVNDGNSDVKLGDTVVSAGDRSTAGQTGTSTSSKPVESKKPSGGSGGGGNSSSSGSGGGGYNHDDDYVKNDSTNKNAQTIKELTAAANAKAKNVTAGVKDDNQILGTDDLVIDNSTVTGILTLELGTANLGNVTIKATNAKDVVINGDGSIQSLTINTPKADVTCDVTVNGDVTVEGVSNNSFHLYAFVKSIIMKGAGRVKVETDSTTPVPSITVNTDEKVTLSGKVENVTVAGDGAKITVEDISTEPTITSQASNVNITVSGSGDKSVTLGGEFNSITATDKSSIELSTGSKVGTLTTDRASTQLILNGTVKTLDAKEGGIINGSGFVANVETGGDLKANINMDKVTATGKDTVAISGNAVIREVVANTSISLEISVEKVAVTRANVSIDTISDVTITTVETTTSVEIKGEGSVGSVDVNSTTDVVIKVSDTAKVDQVANTGDTTGNVKIDPDSTGTVPTDVVEKQKPIDAGSVVFNPPVKGATDLTKSTMEIKDTTLLDKIEFSTDKKGWTRITTTTVDIKTGVTYYVRRCAEGVKLAGDPISGSAPVVAKVTSVTITGTPTVGQTLTAVANSDATAPLTYKWVSNGKEVGTSKSIELIGGYSANDLTVTVTNIYGSASKTVKVASDVSKLNTAIAKAGSAKAGVQISELTPAEMAKGVVFVSRAEMTALENAVNEASKITSDDKQDDVDKAVDTLNAAVSAFESAKKTGTLTEEAKLKEALNEQIGKAEILLRSVPTSENGYDVAPTSKRVTKNTYDTYEAAITSAKDALNTATDLSAAITALNNATVKFQSSFLNGATIDTTALHSAIVNAQGLTTSRVSVDGNDVEPSQMWTTQAAVDNLKAAITTAEDLKPTVQQDVVAALADLNAEVNTFNNTLKTGTPFDLATLNEAIGDAERLLAETVISEDGKDVDPSKSWAMKADCDEYQIAITNAKDAALLKTFSDVENMKTKLATATANFNLKRADGGATPAITHKINIETPVGGSVEVKDADGNTVSHEALVKEGTVLTITATPDGTHTLKELSVKIGDSASASIENGTQITVTGDVTIKATFEEIVAPTHTVTFSAEPTEGGTVTVMAGITSVASGDQIAEGVELTIKAEPKEGYTLAGITVNGDPLNAAGTHTVGNADVVIVATFENLPEPPAGQVNVTYSVSPTAGGTLTVSGGVYDAEGNMTAKAGDTLTIVPTPASNYTLSEITVNGTKIEAVGGEYTYEVKDSDTKVEILATFKAPGTYYNVTLTQPTEGGTLTVNGLNDGTNNVLSGTQLTINANATDGYVLEKITAGVQEFTTSPATYTVSGNATITATFKVQGSEPTTQHTVTVTMPTEGGTLTVKTADNQDLTLDSEGKAKVDNGTKLTITAVAYKGYTGGATVSTGTIGNDGTYTVNGDVAIATNFKVEQSDPVYGVVYQLSNGVGGTVRKDSENVYTISLGNITDTGPVEVGVPDAENEGDELYNMFFSAGSAIADQAALTTALSNANIQKYTAIGINFVELGKADSGLGITFDAGTAYTITQKNPCLQVYSADNNVSDSAPWTKTIEATGAQLNSAQWNPLALLLAKGGEVTLTIAPKDNATKENTITIHIVDGGISFVGDSNP